MRNSDLLVSIPRDVSLIFIKHAEILYLHLSQKSEDEWSYDDVVLWLDILRFRCDSVSEELPSDASLQLINSTRLDRMYAYWNQIINLYSKATPEEIKKQKPKEIYFVTH